MAFKIHSMDDCRVPVIEYLPCSAITPKVGMALTQTSGKLAIATGTTKPSYISLCERETACAAGDIIPVMRVSGDAIFEVPTTAAMTAVNLGDKVTLHTDGLQITATATSGVAEVVGYPDGTAKGAIVRVRF